MDAETVRGWVAAAETEVSELSAELDRLQFRLADKRRQLMLLYEVLATLTNSPVGLPMEQMGINRSTRARVAADVEAILGDRGHPMRIQDIHAEFIRRAMPLPGRGTPTNIAAHLVDAKRFRRFGRGVYGLEAWNTTSHAAAPVEQADAGMEARSLSDRETPADQGQASAV
jgi:hypothetical protein